MFEILNFMTSSNASAWDKKYILLLNKVGSKLSLVKGGVHIHITTQNLIFLRFPVNPPLKMSNVEHTIIIRNAHTLSDKGYIKNVSWFQKISQAITSK